MLAQLVFRKLPGKSCVVEKNLGRLRGLGLPPTAGSVTQWGQPPPLVTWSHPNLRPWELK